PPPLIFRRPTPLPPPPPPPPLAPLAPIAVRDAYRMIAGHPLLVAGPGVLANDADPDGDALTAVAVTGPAHGTLTLAADGAFAYAPDAGFAGVDTFTYRVSDGSLDSAAVTVTITVAPAPQLPPPPPLPPPPISPPPVPPP